jgi:hypothetical protein
VCSEQSACCEKGGCTRLCKGPICSIFVKWINDAKTRMIVLVALIGGAESKGFDFCVFCDQVDLVS